MTDPHQEDGASMTSHPASNFARPWWALRAGTVYRGVKRVYKYGTSFPGAYCLARFGEQTAEGALQLTGVDRLGLEEPDDIAKTNSYKRAPIIGSIDYNFDKSLEGIDSWIDKRLGDPSTIEGHLLVLGSSWGTWIAQQLPFGSQTTNPAMMEAIPAAAVETEPAKTTEAVEDVVTEAATDDADDETKATEADVGGTEDYDAEEDGLQGLATGPSSSSLVSMDESVDAGKKTATGTNKKPKGKARRLLRSMGNSFKKAINFPKSPHTTPAEEGSTTQETGTTTSSSATTAAATAPQSHFPSNPKYASEDGSEGRTAVSSN